MKARLLLEVNAIAQRCLNSEETLPKCRGAGSVPLMCIENTHTHLGLDFKKQLLKGVDKQRPERMSLPFSILAKPLKETIMSVDFNNILHELRCLTHYCFNGIFAFQDILRRIN